MAISHWKRIIDFFNGLGLPIEMLEHTCITEQEAALIEESVVRHKARRLLEIGSFVGVSGGVMALAAGPDSHLTIIDPGFPVSVEGASFAYRDQRSSRHYRELLHSHFDISDRVKMVDGYYSCKPVEAALRGPAQFGADVSGVPVVGFEAACGEPFDFVFLDADHHAPSVSSDLSLISTQLADDGLIVLHDYSGGWQDEVRAGLRNFLAVSPMFVTGGLGSLAFIRKRRQ